MFTQLKHHKAKTGSLRVTKKSDLQLSGWVYTQRYKFQDLENENNRTKYDELEKERFRRLKSIGFDFECKRKKAVSTCLSLTKVDQDAKAWDAMFTQLKHHKAKTGSLRVTALSDRNLFLWVRKQKQMMIAYQHFATNNETSGEINVSEIIQGRVRLLKSIGCGSIDNGVRKEEIQKKRWHNMFERLKKYQEKYRDMHLVKSHDPKLYSWINVQEKLSKDDESNSKMTEIKCERIKMLKSLVGFEKRQYRHNDWKEMYELLKEFKEKTGSLCVPSRSKLYGWLHYQKSLFKEDNQKHPKFDVHTKNERKRLLQEIGFEGVLFRPYDARPQTTQKNWMEMFERLKTHKEKTGSCFVAKGKSQKLKNWVKTQRTLFKEHDSVEEILDEFKREKIKLLKSINYEETLQDLSVTSYNQNWNYMFAKLKEHKVQTGSLCVPNTKKKLQIWVRNQEKLLREYEKADCIFSETKLQRVRLLKDVGFDANEPRQKLIENSGFRRSFRGQWKDFFEELREFHEIFGHFDVPEGLDDKLHSWTQHQKLKYCKKELTESKPIGTRSIIDQDRISLLEIIGFIRGTSSDKELCDVKTEESKQMEIVSYKKIEEKSTVSDKKSTKSLVESVVRDTYAQNQTHVINTLTSNDSVVVPLFKLFHPKSGERTHDFKSEEPINTDASMVFPIKKVGTWM